MSDTVLVQDRYYRKLDGTIRHERWIEDRFLECHGQARVVFVDWWNVKSMWTTLVKRPTALVKEGPKAMVLYRLP